MQVSDIGQKYMLVFL